MLKPKPWCWRSLLRVPWTARRSNQTILKEITPEYLLEGLMLKLKLWPPDEKSWLTGKDSEAGKIEGRRRGWQRMRWLDDITDSMDECEQTSGDSEGQGSLACYSPWGHKELDTTKQLYNTIHTLFKVFMEHSLGYTCSASIQALISQKMKIISMISSNDNTMRLEIKKKTEKGTNPWRLNNMLLNSQWVTEEVKKVIKLIKILGDKWKWNDPKIYGLQQNQF